MVKGAVQGASESELSRALCLTIKETSGKWKPLGKPQGRIGTMIVCYSVPFTRRFNLDRG